MRSHIPHLPLVFNEEQVLSTFYEERKRRSNSLTPPHHSLLQKNSYFSNALGQRVQQKQKLFNNTLGSRQLSRIHQNNETEIETRKQTNNMSKRRANSEVNALQNIDMACLNKIVTQNTKNIKQEVLNAKDRARNHASRKQNLQELESSFKNLTGHEITGFGTGKQVLKKKTNESKNRKNLYDQNTDVNLLKDCKQIYTLGSSSKKVGIGKNGKALKQVDMKFQYDEPLILLVQQDRYELNQQKEGKTESEKILGGEKQWESSQKFKYDYLNQELKSEEFESPKFKTDFCQKQYKVFTHNKVDQNQKEIDCQQNNTKAIKYDSLETQKEFYASGKTQKQKQLEDKLAELQEKYDEMEKVNSKQLKFIESVYKMRKTLENTDTDCSLKQLWRWVKNLPHSH